MFNKLKKAAIAMIYGHHDVHFFSCFSESVGWKPVRLPGDDARPRPAQSNIAFLLRPGAVNNSPLFLLLVLVIGLHFVAPRGNKNKAMITLGRSMI